jgi:hypothetical protein
MEDPPALSKTSRKKGGCGLVFETTVLAHRRWQTVVSKTRPQPPDA